MLKQLQQFASYGLGGGLAFAVTTVTLLIAEGAHWPHLIAAAIAYLAGFFVNFFFQAIITFQTGRNQVAIRLVRFALVQAVGFIFFVGLLTLLIEMLRLHFFVAYLTTVIFTFVLNFILSKRFAFTTLPQSDLVT